MLKPGQVIKLTKKNNEKSTIKTNNKPINENKD